MSLRRSVAAAVAVATVSLVSAAGAGPWALKPGESYSELSGSYFSTRTYFQNSDEARVGIGGKFEERRVRSHNEFGWKKRASVWLEVPFVSRTFAPDAGGAATSTGLGDLDFGIRFGVLRGTLPFAIELGWTAPLGANRKLFPGTSGAGGADGTSFGTLAGGSAHDSSTFFNTGLQSLSIAGQLGGSVGKSIYWTLGGGYINRYLAIGSRRRPVGTRPNKVQNFNRWSNVMTTDATLGVWVSHSLLLSGAFRGEYPLYQNPLYDRVDAPIAGANGPDLEPVSLLAGPRLTYRVDDKMDVFAGSWHTPSGRNVLHADHYYAGIAWRQTGLDRLAGALGGTRSR